MRNRGYVYVDRIGVREAGVAALDHYVARYRHHDREGWRALFEAGAVRRDGRTVVPGEVLQAGWRLEYHRGPWDEPEVPDDLPILLIDDDIVVVAKPAGLPVTPGAGCMDRSLVALARARIDPEARPVHRLDRGTSGVVILARNAPAAAALFRAFRSRRVDKRYLARVQGADIPDILVIDVPVGPVPYPPLRPVAGACPGGRPAWTDVRVVGRDPGRDQAVVEAHPRTGRPQQIRIHLAWAGHPLVGEPLYGPGGLPRPVVPGTRPPVSGDIGFALHAWQLDVAHPRTGALLHLVAPPPDGLAGPDGG